MKIALTGSGGQLGSEWKYFLGTKDYEFNVFDSEELDITLFDRVEGLLKQLKPDILINCAAYTAVDRAEEEKEKARLINYKAVENLSRCCKMLDIKLVHFSTDYIFPGTAGDRKKYPDGYPEGHPAEPINWYGKTKWEGEQAIRNSGCEHLIIRTTWLCGRFGDNFVKSMLKLGKEREKLKVVGDQWGSPSYTDEVVKNTHKLIERSQKGTFHITSKGLTTWYEFAKTIFDYSNLEVNILSVTSEEFKANAERPFFSKLSTKKVEQVEGIQIKDWQIGLKNLMKDLNSC